MNQSPIILSGEIINWTGSEIPMVAEEMAAQNDVPTGKLVFSRFDPQGGGNCCFRDTTDLQSGAKIGTINERFPLYEDASPPPSSLRIAQARCDRSPWPRIDKSQGEVYYIVPRIMVLHAVVEGEYRNRAHILERMLIPAGRVVRGGGTVGFTGFIRGTEICTRMEKITRKTPS